MALSGRVSPRTIFQRQLTNLGIKLFDLAVFVLSLFDFFRENAGHAFNRLPLPRAYLRSVQLPIGRDLLHRLVTKRRLKRHSSLKLV